MSLRPSRTIGLTPSLLGCLFDDPNNVDPSCLGNATLSIGSDLVETSFGLEE